MQPSGTFLRQNRGQVDAQNNLAAMYQHGLGVDRDYLKAVKLYLAASQQGSVAATNNLGAMYEAGLGVRQDFTKAFELYAKAAHQGDPVAQSNLGFMYAHGQGVPRDLRIAAQWYQLSSKQDYVPAKVTLARMYAKGEGVPLDYVTAYALFVSAASAGNETAKRSAQDLARIMVPHQRAEAEARLAAGQQSSPIPQEVIIEKHLSPTKH